MIAVAGLAHMFRIVPNPTFVCDVPLSVPGTDKPGVIKITYRHMDRRALHAYQARAVDLAMDADLPDAQDRYRDYVAEVIDTWSGVVDAAGRPVPYSLQALGDLLQAFPASGPEIVRHYARQLSHARAGN